MAKSKRDDFITGPFYNATIEGFIIHETEDEYGIVISKILEVNGDDPPPNTLKEGAVHIIPKEVVDEFFILLDANMQLHYINLTIQLGDKEWAYDLFDRFYNPYRVGTDEFKEELEQGKQLLSDVLNLYLRIDKEEKEKLFEFYSKSLNKGLSKQFNGPEDINSPAAVDTAISYIVFAGKETEGINYVRSLINRGKWLK
jgi:hypothetical protein